MPSGPARRATLERPEASRQYKGNGTGKGGNSSSRERTVTSGLGTKWRVARRDEPSTQMRTGALMFGGFLVAAVVIGWLMYPLPL